jgi:hypothetical protein
MPEIKIVRRWGAHDAGQTVDVDDQMAAWLIGNSFGEDPSKPGTASAGSLAPGADGADLRAGGDVSRGGGMRIVKGSRVDGENYANRAARVPGAPRAGGAIAPKDLPRQDETQSGDPDEQGGESGKRSSEARTASGESSGSAPAYPVSQQPESSQPAKVGEQSKAEQKASQG